jgi:hypothetical protein
MALAARSRAGIGRWLVNDERADEWDERDAYTQRAVQGRIEAKAQRQNVKARRKAWRRRRDLVLRAGKVVKSTMRKARHRSAMTIYRALYIAGLWRGQLPGGSGHE